MKIGLISGSPRPLRNSHKVALAAFELLEKYDNIEVEIFDIANFNLPNLENPIYDQKNPSEVLKSISKKLQDKDAFLIVTPEHNGSYSGALKNFLDHFGPEYTRKAVGIVAVSTGMLGGALAGRELQMWVLKINAVAVPQYLITPKVNSLFNEQDKLIDESYGKRMQSYIDNFLWYAKALRDAREKS